jgi:hypothetical protein
MQQGNGSISENDLMMRLVQAKKIMNKVDNGDYETGHVNEQTLRSSPEELGANQMMAQQMSQQMTQQRHMPQQMGGYDMMEESRPSPTRPVNSNNLDVNRIKNTKLPENIKKLMIEHPIQQPQQISLADSLDINFVNKARKLMEQEGVNVNKSKGSSSRTQQTQVIHSKQDVNEIINALTPIIENTIRKIMDEKLNQLLTAQKTTSINENLVVKVGDSVFSGKITKVNKAK